MNTLSPIRYLGSYSLPTPVLPALYSSPRYALRTRSFPSNFFASSSRTISPVSMTYPRSRGLERHLRVLFDEQDRDALLVDLLDDIENRLDHLRGQTHRGLVQHQDLGVSHEGPADREHLLLATRQRAAELLPPLLHPGEQTRRRDRGPRAISCVGPSALKAPISRFSDTDMFGKMWRPSGTWMMPLADDLVAAEAYEVLAFERDRPTRRDRAPSRSLAESWSCRRRYRRSSVTISPSWTLRLTPLTAWITP